MIQCIATSASETTIWQGSKRFTGWGDQLTIEGNKFSSAKSDDVLCLRITASSGAQLQLSWGSSWTCFDGLEHLDINGDYEMLLTAEMVNRIRQGIHIKGVNYTLTAVTLKSNDGEYTTESASLFAWKDMLMSGAVKGQSCTVNLKSYAGAGWYWNEPVDLSSYGSIVIRLLQPAAETMLAQLLYNDRYVKRQTLVKGATECKLALTASHTKCYSVNIISEKAQTVAIGSVDLTDQQGNVVSSVLSSPDTKQVLSVEYYDTAGIRRHCLQPGINIIKKNLKGGRSIVRKEIR